MFREYEHIEQLIGISIILDWAQSGLEKTLEAGSSFRERNLVSEIFWGFLDMSRENNIKNGHLTPFLMVSSHFQQSKFSKISRQRVISYFCANFVINHTRNLRRKNLGFWQLPRKKKTFSNPAVLYSGRTGNPSV